MLIRIDMDIEKKNTHKKALACVQTSPISFVARNKGNRRRLHAGKKSTSKKNKTKIG